MPELGLLGKNISYSFSRAHFTAKFENENLPYSYVNFDIDEISKLKDILKNNSNLKGFNVTIPYKEQIIPFLDDINKKARKIGAVNTVTISKTGRLKGYNTDYYGFKKSIQPYLKPHHKNALILGTGGASKAIAYALKKLKIDFDYVSRSQNTMAKFLYSDLTPEIIASYTIIINCTPIGTHPNVNECPDIPYDGITDKHILYDLIYNPSHTKFLICGEIKGAATCNGLEMLELQAEKAWKIWKLS
ncbi:shikimate dehydrogenase [Ichthyenterobacterium magnum]|uniref:Shikimate dehydrogenase n=2 Tax=Ichthyenterobacterium magnum TaxID=1230530 RepID=A0A420DGY8_9FLAO|nr:shikimate dehydrogenase [Ichthyenterobacterium magnum]